MPNCREGLITGVGWLNLTKSLKVGGGLFVGQHLIKMMLNKVKWVVKLAFFKKINVWLYVPCFSNPENSLCDIHISMKVLKD